MIRLYLASTVLSFLILQGLGDNVNLFSKFHQDEFKMKDYRLALESCDKDIFHICDLETYQYNQSLVVVNGTLMTNVNVNGKEIDVDVRSYKFINNKYRLFPINFKGNLFNTIKFNVVGLKDTLRCGNIPLESFYFRKAVKYQFCNVYPDATAMPPILPLGKYMVTYKLIYKHQELLLIRGYAELYIPVE